MNYEETVYGWCPLDTTETSNKIWNRELLPFSEDRNPTPIPHEKINISNSFDFPDSNVLVELNEEKRYEEALRIVYARIEDFGQRENTRFETCDFSLPGFVLDNGDGTYTLLDGQHRLLRSIVTQPNVREMSCFVITQKELDSILCDHNSFPIKSSTITKKVKIEDIFGFDATVYKRNKKKLVEQDYLRHYMQTVVKSRFPETKKVAEKTYENEQQNFIRSVCTAFTSYEVLDGDCELTFYNPMLQYMEFTEGYSNAMSMLPENLVNNKKNISLSKGEICVFYASIPHSFNVDGKLVSRRYSADPIREYMNEETVGTFRLSNEL